MRRKLSAQAPVRFLPLCLLTPLACQGHYVLGEMPPVHAGSGGGDTTSNGGSNTTSNGGSSTTSNGGDTTGNGDLPQFACTKVASQQFDSATMQPYYVSPEVQTKVANLVNGMSATEKATQMIGIAAGQMDYQDVQRSPDVLIAGGA